MFKFTWNIHKFRLIIYKLIHIIVYGLRLVKHKKQCKSITYIAFDLKLKTISSYIYIVIV